MDFDVLPRLLVKYGLFCCENDDEQATVRLAVPGVEPGAICADIVGKRFSVSVKGQEVLEAMLAFVPEQPPSVRCRNGIATITIYKPASARPVRFSVCGCDSDSVSCVQLLN